MWFALYHSVFTNLLACDLHGWRTCHRGICASVHIRSSRIVRNKPCLHTHQSLDDPGPCDGLAINTGITNTATIIATTSCNLATDAANLANDYSLNGWNDWFLPSQDELNQLYLQRGGTNFNNGNQDDVDKNRTLRVRAVRAF